MQRAAASCVFGCAHEKPMLLYQQKQNISRFQRYISKKQ
jgi:hypothetical protein